MHKIIYTK